MQGPCSTPPSWAVLETPWSYVREALGEHHYGVSQALCLYHTYRRGRCRVRKTRRWLLFYSWSSWSRLLRLFQSNELVETARSNWATRYPPPDARVWKSDQREYGIPSRGKKNLTQWCEKYQDYGGVNAAVVGKLHNKIWIRPLWMKTKILK